MKRFSSILQGFLTVGLLSASLFGPLPAFAQADGCGTASELSAEESTAIRNLPESAPASMSCQDVSGATPDARSSRCVATGLCSGTRICCLPGTGVARGGTGGTTGATGGTGTGGSLGLRLPACISDGNCGLDDIIETGVNFSNFLFGISGAIFLAIFVYAGFKYIFYASNPSEASSSRGMLVNATIGIILMFGASALVTTTYNAFRAGTSGGNEQCAAAYPTYSCQALTANYDDVTARNAEITSRRCQSGLCGEHNQLVCCPPSGSAAPTPTR